MRMHWRYGLTTASLIVALVCWLVLLAFPPSAHAWGEQGHRISGLVAQELLTPQAKLRVKAIMGNLDLATASLFLDINKFSLSQKIPGSREWHYNDRPVCDDKVALAEYCLLGNCASTQIRRHYRALIDEHSSAPERVFAIRVLAHLVGDVHQPLHASDHDDRGGNDVPVAFTVKGKHRSVNLHAAWDTEFVRAAFDTLDERVIAKRLVQQFAAQIPGWQSGAGAAWLKESYALAQQAAYFKLPGFECDKEAGAQRVDLPDEYVARAVEIIPEQLAKSGARIAYLLNRAFAK